MYKKILVPLELSHTSSAENSIKVAQTLLKKDGDITLLHIVEDLPGYVQLQLAEETQMRNIDEATATLEGVAKKFAKDANCKVVIGHASRAILEYANKHKMECIIVASHKPGFEDYLIGSTASRIVRHAKCAVHVPR